MWIALALWVQAAAIECQPASGTADGAALAATSVGIREAFARSDVAAIARYHHPDITKSLAPDRFFSGQAALVADLRATFATVRLRFVTNDVERLDVCGDTAVEMTRYAVEVTPRAGGAAATVRGRAMIVYVRSATAPNGWLSLRELVQPHG